MLDVIAGISGYVAGVYDGYIRELRGELARAISLRNPVKPSVKREFVQFANRQINAKLPVIESTIHSGIALVITEVNSQFTSEERSKVSYDAITQYVETLLAHQVGEVQALMTSDISVGVRKLQTLKLDTAANMVGATLENAIKGAVVKSIVGGGSYVGAGKEWKTVREARINTHHHLLTLYNDVMVYLCSSLGEYDLEIKNAAGHRLNKTGISVDDYADQKATIFHPGSKSLVYRKISQ